jgi:biotin transport system substrate-specific component
MSNTTTVSTLSPVRQGTLARTLWITGFAALTAVGAYVEIPHQPVPYTLQTFFVLLAGAMLGKKDGFCSQLLYLAVGAIGVPVFSGGGFGLAKLLGPTGGYLLSFPVAAFVTGYLLQNNSRILWVGISMLVGSLVIFSLGTVQLYVIFYREWVPAIVNGFLMFSWWDVVKIAAAVGIYSQLKGRFPR